MLDNMSEKTISLVDYRPKNKKPVIALLSIYGYESSAIRYIAAAVRKAGHTCYEVYFEDMKRNFFRYPTSEELDVLIGLLRDKGVDIVGISVRSSYRKMAALVTDKIHADLGIPVLWGSMHPTICPEDSLKYADAICVGDGEVATVQLLDAIEKGKDTTGINGIWVKKSDGSVVRNGWTDWVDVNASPYPEYDAPGKYFTRDGEVHEGDPMACEPAITVISARGCPHKCHYCSNAIFINAEKGFLRLRKIDNVIAEIKAAQKCMNINRVKFYDELFATNKKWTDEFVEKYPKEIGLPFDAFLHPNHVTDSLISKLVSAGLSTISMGIESASERVANELYGRGATNKRVMESVEILHKYKVNSNYDLLIDNPLETAEDRDEAFEFLFRMPRPFTLFIFSLKHLPETALTKRLLKEGHITEADVEGEADRSLFQWEVSLTYKRSAEEKYWLALVSLLTKNFIPKPVIKMLSKPRLLKKFPGPLVLFAWMANVAKLSLMVQKRLRAGTLSFQELRRHANLKNLIVK